MAAVEMEKRWEMEKRGDGRWRKRGENVDKTVAGYPGTSTSGTEQGNRVGDACTYQYGRVPPTAGVFKGAPSPSPNTYSLRHPTVPVALHRELIPQP